MEKEYMVIGFGKSKKDGTPYSRACRVKQANDGTWGYVDIKDVFFLDDIRSLGSVVKVEQMEV